MQQFNHSCAACLLFGTSFLLAAQTAPTTTGAPNATSAPSAQSSKADRAQSKLDAMKSDVQVSYLANPSEITALGLRSQWQVTIPSGKTALMAGMSLDGIEIFAWDQFGIVTRLKSETGSVLWQGSTQSKLDKIFGVNILAAGTTPAALALTDAESVAFEDGSGALLAQQSLRRVPATAGATSENSVVFGDAEGRIIWLNLMESNIAKVQTKRNAPGEYTSSSERPTRRTVICREEYAAMSLGKVVTPPVSVSGVGVLTVSTGGEVCLFHATNSKPIWKFKSNAPFVSKPVTCGGVVYVAGKDQYLHALDLKTGHVMWDWFTQVPLLNSPLATSDLVVLQVPEEGLVAFNANPGEKVGGAVQWKSKAAGNAITRTKDGFIVWDDASRTMTLVETKAGGITASASFLNAVWVGATSPVDGTIMLLSKDGRMQQLRPIEFMKAVTTPKAVDEKPKNNENPAVDPDKVADMTENAGENAGESTP